MANVFSHNTALSERDILTTKYRNARINLLIVALATLLNVILAATVSDSYFLFSATIPYILTFLSALLCGLYPAEYYEGLGAVNVLPMGVFFACLAVSLIIIGLYVLAFFLSGKNRAGWMIFALVLFCLDTLTLFLYAGISLDWLLDYIFHIWIIVILALGLRAHAKLKNLPPEASDAPIILQDTNGEMMTFESENSEAAPFEGENSTAEDSVPLRSADMTVKQKVLLEATVNSKSILYRRVKRTNELVINGQVYDEYVALVEMPHALAAIVDGHLYEAGFNASRSFIAVDGQEIASKLRLI